MSFNNPDGKGQGKVGVGQDKAKPGIEDRKFHVKNIQGDEKFRPGTNYIAMIKAGIKYGLPRREQHVKTC